MREPAGSSPFCSAEQRRYVLVAAILASALGFIDGTVVSIAMPAMRASLNASLTEAQWISNSYMLMLSAFMLVGGAAGDKFGLRIVFVGAIGFFVAASVLCAIAPSAPLLIAARALQGLAAAFMVPGSLAIISKAYPKHERGRAIGIWAAASAVTTAAGPLLGGLLLSWGSADVWRLIFAINLPLGTIALYLLIMKVPADRPTASPRIDIVGSLLAVAMLGLLSWGLTGGEGEGASLSAAKVTPYLLAAILCFAGFVIVESRVSHPLIPLGIFRERVFSAANAVTFFLYFALSAVLFYLPMTLIGGWQMSEAQAGLVFLPLTIAIALMSGRVGKIADRVGPRPLIAAGSLLVGLGYAGLALAMPSQRFWTAVLPMMMLMGVGMGLVVSPLSTAVMGAVSEREQGTASGVNNVVSRVAGLIAVAAMGSLAGAVYPQFGVRIGTGFSEQHLAGSNDAFQYVAAASALMCFLAVAISVIGIRGPKPPSA